MKLNNLPPDLKGKKVSDVFMEYAEPYLEILLSDGVERSLKEIENFLRIPWTIWNSIVLDEGKGKDNFYLKSIDVLIQHFPPQVKNLLGSLKERKVKHFSEYNYMFGEYYLYNDQDTQEVRIKVEARMPQQPVYASTN